MRRSGERGQRSRPAAGHAAGRLAGFTRDAWTCRITVRNDDDVRRLKQSGRRQLYLTGSRLQTSAVRSQVRATGGARCTRTLVALLVEIDFINAPATGGELRAAFGEGVLAVIADMTRTRSGDSSVDPSLDAALPNAVRPAARRAPAR